MLIRDIEKLEEAPELRRTIDDHSVLESHREIIELMMTAMVPAGRSDDYYAEAGESFNYLPFYETPAWRRLGLGDGESFLRRLNMAPEQFAFRKLMWAYESLLHEWLGVQANLQPGLVMTVYDEETRLISHFSL